MQKKIISAKKKIYLEVDRI